MNRDKGVGMVLAAVAVAGVVWMAGGCEVIEDLDKALSIAPSSASLTETSEAVMFTVNVGGAPDSVSGGSTSNSASVSIPVVPPFRWSVSRPELGTIRVSGAYTAIYERNGDAVGNNYLRVGDSAGRYEAFAIVTQTTPEEVPTPDPPIVNTNAP